MNTFNFKFKTLIIALMGVLFFSIGEAYAAGTCYTRASAYLRPGSPDGAGKVYIATTSAAPDASAYRDCKSSTNPAYQLTVAGGQTYHFRALVNAGYKFTGWYDANGDQVTTDKYTAQWVAAGSMALGSATYADRNMYAGFIKIVQLSFVTPENGSFTIKNGDETVSNYATFTVNGLVKLSATPAVGYKLRGWYTTTDGGITKTYFAFCNTCEPNFTSNVTIGAEFVPDDGKATFWVKGTNQLYNNLSDANAAAVSSSSNTIVVVSDGVVGAGTHIISSGVTLLIPSEDKLWGEKYEVATSPRIATKTSGPMPMTTTTFRRLSMVPGAGIECNGAICIGGSLASNSGGNASSYPTGSVGMLDMSRGGTVSLNSGSVLYAWGYVKGMDMNQGNNAPGSGCGTIVAKNGSVVWEFFQVGDWRGGTASSSIYSSSSRWKFFPFQSYTVQNIEAPITLEYGSRERCQWSIFGNGQVNTIPFDLIANSGAVFTLNESTSTVTKWYDPTTDRLCVELGGVSNLGAIVLDVLGQTMNSGSFNLPLPSQMKVSVKGTTTISKPVVMHAGAIIDVQSGGTLNINNQMYLYDKDDWGKYCMYDYYYHTFSSPSIHYNRGDGKSKDNLEDATLVVDGSVVVGQGEYLYATQHGANIMGHGGGTFQYKQLAGNTTMVQCTNLSDDVSVSVRSANLHNENDTYTKASVTTYKNVNGRWFTSSASTPKSNHTYDFTYIVSGDVYGSGGKNEKVSAIWTKKKSGLEIMDQWANVKADACDDWWAGINDGHLYSYEMSTPKAWHQFVKTALSYEDGDGLVWNVYSGTNGKLYAMTEECDIEEYAASDNCLYTMEGVTKALVGSDFIRVEKNNDDAAYHKYGAATTYYICLEDCNWQPATRVAGQHNAYTASGATYIWYNSHWQAVKWDAVIQLYYSISGDNVQICYDYVNGEWVLATAVAEVVDESEIVHPAYSLASAVNQAEDGGATVTIRLLKDFNDVIHYAGGNTCSLDLNGFTLSGTASGIVTLDNNTGKLIIKDQSASGQGKIQLSYNANERRQAVIVKQGLCILNSGTISATNTHGSAGVTAVVVQNGASFQLNGDTVKATSAGETWGIQTESSTTSSVLINGGKVDVKSTSTSAAPIAVYSEGGLTTISAGTVSATTTTSTSAIGVKLATNNARLAMDGGTLTVSAKSNAIGISGVSGVTSAAATVSGGTVNVTATTDGPAKAILSYGTTTVSGGALNATAPSGAYGVEVQGGTTTVNSGTITAITTSSSTAYGLYTAGGTTNVNDGNFAVTTKTSDAYGVYVNTTSPTCNINGGMFMIKTNAGASTSGAHVNGYSSTSVNLKFDGGYFNIAPDIAVSSFLVSGKIVKLVDETKEPTIYAAGYLYKVSGAEFTVSWKNYDGSDLTPPSTTVESGKRPTWIGETPTYSAADGTYVFDGWCTGASNTGDSYLNGNPLPPISGSDKTYYAHYQIIVAEVTANGIITPYTVAKDAWDAAMAYSEATIRLLADNTDMPQLEFSPTTANSVIILDLNGHHWDMTSAKKSPFLKVNSSNGSQLVVTDNGSGTGYLLNQWESSSSSIYGAQVTNGELVLESGAIKCTNPAAGGHAMGVGIKSGALFTMIGGTVETLRSNTTPEAKKSYGVYIESGGSADLTGGTVKSTQVAREATGIMVSGSLTTGENLKVEVTGTKNCYAIEGVGTVTVNGGEFEVTASGTVTSNALFYPQTSANYVINGNPVGTLSADKNAYAIYTKSGQSDAITMTVNGGTYSSNTYILCVPVGAVEINNGKFHAPSNKLITGSNTSSLKIRGGWYTDFTKSTLESYVQEPGTVKSLTSADQPEYDEDYRYHVTTQYTITWADGVGGTLRTDYVDRFVTPSYGADPVRSDANGVYNFTGWTPEIVPATENATYTAHWQKVEAELIVQEHTKRFIHFYEAFDYIKTNELSEATIRLLSSVGTTSTYTFDRPYHTTIDLNHKFLIYSASGTGDKFLVVDNDNAVVTITDNSGSEGTIRKRHSCSGTLCPLTVEHGSLILEKGKVIASNLSTGTSDKAYGVQVNGGSFTMTGGSIIDTAYVGARGVSADGANAQFLIEGGQIKSVARNTATTTSNAVYGIHAINNAEGVVRGTTQVNLFTNHHESVAVFANTNSKITVENGTFNNHAESTTSSYIVNICGVKTAVGSELNISGGTFSCTSGSSNDKTGLGMRILGGKVTVEGSPIFNAATGVRVIDAASTTHTATVLIKGGTFNCKTYGLRVDGKHGTTYDANADVKVTGGYFNATGTAIASLTNSTGINPASTLVLYGGYYNEKSSPSWYNQINNLKDENTQITPITETIGDVTYKYKLTTSYTVTWEAGSSYSKNELCAAGAMPSNDEVTTFVSGGKTYVFDHWTPDLAPVYGDITYTAVGALYEAKVKVGSGDWTVYEHFDDAWNEVQNYEEATITLLNDVELDHKILYKPQVANARTEFDLNGYTLSADGAVVERLMEISKADAVLTITSHHGVGEIVASGNCLESFTTVYIHKGELVVENGSVRAENFMDNANCKGIYGVYLAYDPNSKLTVKEDGTVGADAYYKAYGIYSYGTVNVTGNSYVWATASKSSACCVEAMHGTATISGGTLEATAESGASGCTADAWVSADGQSIRQGTVTIESNAEIIVTASKNGSSLSQGAYAGAAAKEVGGVVYTAHGTVNINGGTITVTNSAENASSLYGVNVEGDRVFNSATPHSLLGESKGVCTITNGTILVQTKSGSTLVGNGGVDAIHVLGSATVTGGTFTVNSLKRPYGVRILRGDISISGNPTFTITGSESVRGICVADYTTPTLCDDEIANNRVNVSVSGGTFTLTATGSSKYAEGCFVGGDVDDDGKYAMEGHVTVSGGVFDITAPTGRAFNVANSATATYMTTSPHLTVTGGKFKLTNSTSRRNFYQVTKDVSQVDLQGGYYSHQADLDNYCVSPYGKVALTNEQCTAAGMPNGSYRVEQTDFGRELTIVDWTSNTLTIDVSDWYYDGWPYNVNGEVYTVEQRGSDRTLTIPYTGSAGTKLTITVLNKDDDLFSKHSYVIPKTVTTATTLTTTQTQNIYVHGTTLTINGNIPAKNIYLNPGAKLVINSSKTLTADSIFFRTNIDQAAELVNNGTIASATKIIYTRIIAKKDNYYQFGLPWTTSSISVKDVRLANGKDPKYGATGGWVLRKYNEATRAANGVGNNWVTVGENEIVTGGVGYEMFSDVNYYREFYFPVTIPSPLPTSVPVTHTNGAAGEDNCGWNILVSPLTSTYANSQYPEAPVICWMTPHGFEQDIPASIPPAKVFAYQAAHSGSLSFGNTIVLNNAPRRIKSTDEEIRIQWIQLNIEDANGAGDQTSVYSHPTRYEQTYQTGIDVAKQMLTGPHAILYSLHAYGEMAFAGVADDVLEQGVALTVYSPSAQELTISMRDNDWLNRLEKVYLVDNETGLRIDLLMQDYTFDAEAGTTEGRFVLQGVFKAPQGTTDIEPTSDSSLKGREVEKLVIHDKLYIRVNGTLYDATGKQVKK